MNMLSGRGSLTAALGRSGAPRGPPLPCVGCPVKSPYLQPDPPNDSPHANHREGTNANEGQADAGVNEAIPHGPVEYPDRGKLRQGSSEPLRGMLLGAEVGVAVARVPFNEDV